MVHHNCRVAGLTIIWDKNPMLQLSVEFENGNATKAKCMHIKIIPPGCVFSSGTLSRIHFCLSPISGKTTEKWLKNHDRKQRVRNFYLLHVHRAHKPQAKIPLFWNQVDLSLGLFDYFMLARLNIVSVPGCTVWTNWVCRSSSLMECPYSVQYYWTVLREYTKVMVAITCFCSFFIHK